MEPDIQPRTSKDEETGVELTTFLTEESFTITFTIPVYARAAAVGDFIHDIADHFHESTPEDDV